MVMVYRKEKERKKDSRCRVFHKIEMLSNFTKEIEGSPIENGGVMIRSQIWEMGTRNKIQREIQVASRRAQRQPSVPRLTCMQSKLEPWVG